MSFQPSQCANIVELLCERVNRHPERLALRCLGDGENVTETLSYGDLHTRASGLAQALSEYAAPGERALLLYPSGSNFVTALLACFYSAVLAVPAYPPESLRAEHVGRILGILRDARPRLVLTERTWLAPLEQARQILPELRDVRIVCTDDLDTSGAALWKQPRLDARSIAFLQYTSGSTSQPKGVMVGHDNLMANERVIQRAFDMRDDDVVVSWLPLFHDMGLIGSLLQPLYSGVSVVLMGPREFMERPLRWPLAIARYGGTVSGAPDFAYRLCAARLQLEPGAALDLSRWRLAFCGAEPIRPGTLRAFADKFAPFGFDPAALYPCYGLAEASLLVTGATPSGGAAITSFDANLLGENRVRPSAGGRELVASGQVQPEHEVAILDPETGKPVGREAVGEIHVAGPSITQGYFQNEEATRETFVERGGRVWLRTGDLGFEHDGQLYVAGRHKDLILVRGQNLHPADIERSIEDEIEVVRKGRTLAFAIEVAGEESIAVATEISPRHQKLLEPEALCSAISDVVTRAHGQAPSVVLLMQPGALPITSSGKLQRGLCRKRWQKGQLPAFATYRDGALELGGE